jgi:hypothetical protein
MNMSNDTLVIIPCLNEQGRIGDVIRSVKEVLPAAAVVVIDDASSDRSPEESAAAGAIVLKHGSNLGYGAALETGYLYAVSKGYNTVLQMDGDGQHLAGQLALLVKCAAESRADIVIGSRYDRNAEPGSTSPARKAGHRIISMIIFLLTGLRLSDPTSGFQLLNGRALKFFSSGVFPCDYPDSDVILMAHMAGLKISEVPVEMRARASGKSMHSGLKPLYYAIKMSLAMFIVLLNYHSWRRWRPQDN